MEELENKIINESNVFKKENMNSKEIGYYIYKNYIISVYKLYSIIEDTSEEGSFENVYIVYDTKTKEIFDEYTQDKKSIFEELPGIDDVQFTYDFENSEIVEKSKSIVKEAVLNYYKSGKISKNYKEALKEIYKYIDNSSKEFYNFFISHN